MHQQILSDHFPHLHCYHPSSTPTYYFSNLLTGLPLPCLTPRPSSLHIAPEWFFKMGSDPMTALLNGFLYFAREKFQVPTWPLTASLPTAPSPALSSPHMLALLFLGHAKLAWPQELWTCWTLCLNCSPQASAGLTLVLYSRPLLSATSSETISLTCYQKWHSHYSISLNDLFSSQPVSLLAIFYRVHLSISCLYH